MKLKKGFFPVFATAVFALFLSSGCKNTIDINTKWKEILIVYGTLDYHDTVQYIRVEKAFLNQTTGALEAAKVSDSLLPDSAVVTLTSGAGVITLQRVNYLPKQPGIFGTDRNYVYKTTQKLDSSQVYRVDVINPKSGNHVYAATNMVSVSKITTPVRNSNSKFSISQNYITVDFTPGYNNVSTDLSLTLHYDEFSTADTNTKVAKTATWTMFTGQPVSSFVNTRVLIPRLAFLQFLTTVLSKDKTMRRRLKTVDMSWVGANQVLTDYISVNTPSLGIVQKTADYTNITNGYGIFASRCVQTISGCPIDANSIFIIRSSDETKELGVIP